jgi:hypothetical protein
MANTGNTQQQINYGAAANDGQGDPLRTAFIKTDDNFDAIWNTGPVGSNITILNNTVQSNNVNGNIILRPNGVGVIQANASIVPNTANLRDLGSTNQRWRAAYIGSGGLSVDGNVTVTGNLTAGNISYTGNVFVGDLQGSVYADDSTIMVDAVDNEMFAAAVTFGRANVTGNVNTGTLSVAGNVTANAAGNVWSWSNDTMFFPSGASWGSDRFTLDEYISSAVDGYINITTFDNLNNQASEIQIEHGIIDINFYNGANVSWSFDDSGNFTLPGNTFAVNYANGTQVSLEGSYANANAIALGESGWAGNIIPQANAVYSLGNATNYWSNLWVANNTIYIGGVPLGISAGNVLTVNGEPVGNVDADLPTYGGNILVDYVIGNTTDNAGYLQWEGNSSGDGEGYTTLRLVPDDTLVDNDQYLIIDPTVPSHIHIRAGGTQDDSGAELYLGGEGNFVRVVDGIGVRLQNQTRDNTDYFYSDPGTFTTGSWYEDNGTYFVQYTTVDAELITVTFQFNQDNQNTLLVSYNGGADEAELTSAGSISNLGGGVYRVSVNQAPPASPTVITAFEYEIWSTTNNTVELEGNDFEVAVADDVRITGADGFSLTNESSDQPIEIITNNGGVSRTWSFDSTGNLTVPDNSVIGAATGYVTIGSGDGSGLLVGASGSLFNADNSNFVIYGNLSDPGTSITIPSNLNAGSAQPLTIENQISNVAITAGGNTWTFDTAGTLTAPGNVSATRLQNDANLVLRSNVAGILRNWTFDVLGDLNLPAGGNIVGSGGISANNITLTGNISANTAGFAIGYRDIPQVAFTGNATIATTDAGKHFYSTESSNYVLTIANNASQGFAVGAAITIVNQGTGNITIAQGSGVTLYLAGNATSGDRTISTFGMATIMKVATDTWFINGSGIA